MLPWDGNKLVYEIKDKNAIWIYVE
jgi:hypothetical protein